MTSFDRIHEDDTKPVFTCPYCKSNLFKVNVIEYATGADITTKIEFNEDHMVIHKTMIGNSKHTWIKCKKCCTNIDMDIDQLDAVFSGRYTEEQMKIQCKIIDKPVLLCPHCNEDIFKKGFNEVTTGGLSHAEVLFDSGGADYSDTCIEDMTDQWSECIACGGKIEIHASVLVDYYNGECSLEHITEIQTFNAQLSKLCEAKK